MTIINRDNVTITANRNILILTDAIIVTNIACQRRLYVAQATLTTFIRRPPNVANDADAANQPASTLTDHV